MTTDPASPLAPPGDSAPALPADGAPRWHQPGR